jgi:hypothetical protein
MSKFYEERENEILIVAEDIVEYQRTPKKIKFRTNKGCEINNL